jgi:hypothetical protein
MSLQQDVAQVPVPGTLRSENVACQRCALSWWIGQNPTLFLSGQATRPLTGPESFLKGKEAQQAAIHLADIEGLPLTPSCRPWICPVDGGYR